MLKTALKYHPCEIWLCGLPNYDRAVAWDWKQCLHTLMCRFYMSLKTSFDYCLVITIRTRMCFTLMQRFYMFLQAILCWCLIITMRTRMFNTIMNRFMWVFKFSLCVAWWSQCGQEYLLSSCNDSICAFKHPFLVVW